MAKQVLDLEEWELVLSKMHRHHANIQEEVAVIVQTIRKEMKSDLVPLAEEKANYGKVCIKVDTHFFVFSNQVLESNLWHFRFFSPSLICLQQQKNVYKACMQRI